MNDYIDIKNIAIIGIGGLGGYLGGKLALKYRDDHCVSFVINNKEHYHQIYENGLKLIHQDREYTIRPTNLYQHISQLFKQDLIFLCVKSYSLTDVVNQLHNCIHKNTYIMTLSNGVNNAEIIQTILPKCNIVEGCVYISSHIISTGVVKQTGDICSVYFGSNTLNKGHLMKIREFIKAAGISATLVENIASTLWEKYIYICPISCVTAAYRVNIGEILNDSNLLKIIEQLMEEIRLIAFEKNILLSRTIIQDSINKMKSFDLRSASSFQLDIINRKQSEKEIFLYYILNEGKRYQVATPTFEKVTKMFF